MPRVGLTKEVRGQIRNLARKIERRESWLLREQLDGAYGMPGSLANEAACQLQGEIKQLQEELKRLEKGSA